jgi:hypothetical protein
MHPSCRIACQHADYDCSGRASEAGRSSLVSAATVHSIPSTATRGAATLHSCWSSRGVLLRLLCHMVSVHVLVETAWPASLCTHPRQIASIALQA